MTDTGYLYQYFLEKSDDKKTKGSIHPSVAAKKESAKEEAKEGKKHE